MGRSWSAATSPALGGVTGTTTRNRIGRLNVDGTVDPTFNPGTNGPVLAVAVQADGKILAGGNFTAVGGGTGLTSARSHIARFNADGTVDTSFDPGANLNVYALAVQPDGKILVGGEFSTLGGGDATRIGIGRLNADGSIDAAFNPGVSKIRSAVPDRLHDRGAGGRENPGRRLLQRARRHGRRATSSGGSTPTARSTGFNPGANSISGVNALALQADGKILVGGSFTAARRGRRTRANIGRLNADGSVDIGFNPGAEAQVLTLGVQTDGKILAGGYFKWLGDAGGTHSGRCATTSGGSTPTASSTAPSIRARTTWSTPWRCRRTGRSWPAASSTISATGLIGAGRRNASQPHRADHEHDAGGSDPDPHERWHRRDLAAQRRRAGSLARDVRVLVRRLVLLVAWKRHAHRRRVAVDDGVEPADHPDGVPPCARLLRDGAERIRLNRRIDPRHRRRIRPDARPRQSERRSEGGDVFLYNTATGAAAIRADQCGDRRGQRLHRDRRAPGIRAGRSIRPN